MQFTHHATEPSRTTPTTVVLVDNTLSLSHLGFITMHAIHPSSRHCPNTVYLLLLFHFQFSLSSPGTEWQHNRTILWYRKPLVISTLKWMDHSLPHFTKFTCYCYVRYFAPAAAAQHQLACIALVWSLLSAASNDVGHHTNNKRGWN